MLRMRLMTKQEAIDHFGSVKDLAAALGITREAIYQWRDDAIPLLRAYEVREAVAKRAAEPSAAIAAQGC